MSFERSTLVSKSYNCGLQPRSRLDAVCNIRIPSASAKSWIASPASSNTLLFNNYGIRLCRSAETYRRRRRGRKQTQRERNGAAIQANYNDNSSSADVDFYEVLGVDRNASQQEIRRSYRWLQKKCHPDVAGPELGHRMSVLINQAYSTLAHPDKRAAYDQTLQDCAELDGYTGYPIYSKWLGPAHESEAVFVDEGHCVGCLKCALIAPRTFAIENRYGRARAVAQWADPKPVIEDAIKACPVDCIAWVHRSQLPALEHVMSKAPRYPIGAVGNGGVQPLDVFSSVDRFLEKLRQAEAESKMRRESSAQREARLAAMEEINRAAGRWAWQFINFNVNGKHDSMLPGGLYTISDIYRRRGGPIVVVPNSNSNSYNNSEGPDSEVLRRLYDVLSRAEKGRERIHSPSSQQQQQQELEDEYWKPLTILISVNASTDAAMNNIINVTNITSTAAAAADDPRGLLELMDDDDEWSAELVRWMPVLCCGVAAWFVGVTPAPAATIIMSEAQAGIAPVPVDWIGSSEMRIVLVGVIWYMIGVTVANTVALLTRFLSRHLSPKITYPE